MSLNTKRLASDISKELRLIILEESRNDVLTSITITGCEVTSDLSFCRIYYSFYGNYEKDYVSKELEKAKPFLKKNLSLRVKMRHTPDLLFIYDDSIAYGNKIDELIKEIHENE